MSVKIKLKNDIVGNVVAIIAMLVLYIISILVGLGIPITIVCLIIKIIF